MNLNLILNNYDNKISEFNNIYKLPYIVYNSTSDIDNEIIIYNNDNKLKFKRYILSYIYEKNNKIKYNWSWTNINISNNNNSEIKKIFEYGLKLNNITNNFNDNIKYYLVNSSFYINIFELDIILAISLTSILLTISETTFFISGYSVLIIWVG